MPQAVIMEPHPSPTTSYWTKSPIRLSSSPSPTPESFREPPIVIIGTGITAVSIANSLLPLLPTTHLLVLDARSICDGATGRNGGHCKVVPHEELAKLTPRFGAKRAAELVRFQMRHLESLREICELVDRENGKDKTEFREVETVDLYIDKGLFSEAKGKVEVMKKVMPDAVVKVWEADSAKKVRSCPTYPPGLAGTNHISTSASTRSVTAPSPTKPAPSTPTASSWPSGPISSKNTPLG